MDLFLRGIAAAIFASFAALSGCSGTLHGGPAHRDGDGGAAASPGAEAATGAAAGGDGAGGLAPASGDGAAGIPDGANAKDEPSPPPVALSFFVVGDTRSDPSVAQRVFDSMVKLDPSAIALFNSGDITADGQASQWADHVTAVSNGGAGKIRLDLADWDPAFIRYFGVVGNHDVHDSNWLQTWNTHLSGQRGLGENSGNGIYFSVRHGNALFIVLDTEHDEKAQLPWLQQVLADAAADPSIVWKFAFYHAPIYPCNYKSAWSAGIPWMREFEKHGVDMVFNGHAHVYQRNCPMVGGACQPGGVIQVISGGGGAGTHDMSPDELAAKRSAGPDSYDCGQAVKAAIGSWHHYCHLKIVGSQLDYACYSEGSTANPEDSLTLTKTP